MSDESEATAQLESQAIEAMTVLVAEYGYSESDLGNLVNDAVENA